MNLAYSVFKGSLRALHYHLFLVFHVGLAINELWFNLTRISQVSNSSILICRLIRCPGILQLEISLLVVNQLTGSVPQEMGRLRSFLS